MKGPDLSDPRFNVEDPELHLAALREECPVHFDHERSMWVLARHGDVVAVSKDPQGFCSGRGVLIGDRSRAIAAADSLLYLDPPQHGRYRRLVSRAFTPRTVAGLEPSMRVLAAELLDAVDPAADTEMVDAFSAPIALLVIARLLGIGEHDRDQLRRWSDAVMEAATDLNDENGALAAELLMFLDAQLDERARRPADDLLTALGDADVDGVRLTRDEQLGFCMTLFVAGNETSRALISGGLVALAEHPDQRAALAADPTTITDAVEELLRWVTPITAMARTATTGAVVGDQRIAAGDYVVLSYLSANRDGAVFGCRADHLDVTRNPNPHVAFGFGEHYCLGAGLARLEARVAFEEVLSRFPHYELIGPVERPPSSLLRQISRLPLRLQP